jgi:hypothetical protein
VIQDPFSDAEFEKMSPARQAPSASSANRQFEFQKSSRDFLRVHNETLSVAAMCVNNPDCLSLGING